MKISEFEFQDWLIIFFVTLAWVVASIYLFKHPSEVVFGSWCGLAGTLCGTYHWLTIKDAKVQDAG